MNIRQAILGQIELLSQPSKQLEYERSLSRAGHAPSELISGFCDDLYHPKSPEFIGSFSEEELRDLAHLYGLIVEASRAPFQTVSEMLKNETWRRVISVAKELVSRFEAPT